MTIHTDFWISNRSKLTRPRLETGASIDSVLCYPARTPNEHIWYQMNQRYWWEWIKNDSIAKRDILASMSTDELKEMLRAKRWEVEKNNSMSFVTVNRNASEDIQILTQVLNKKIIKKLNDPLVYCIVYLDRMIRERLSQWKEDQIDLVELKNRVSILEVIESYTSIGRYRPWQLIKCMMPKHQDKTQSFMIYEKENKYYCFGCHAKWTQIDFIMAMENCSTKDAIKKLSKF